MSTERNDSITSTTPDADPRNADWPKRSPRHLAGLIDSYVVTRDLLWEVLPQLEGWAAFLAEEAPNEGDHERLEDLISRIKTTLGVTA